VLLGRHRGKGRGGVEVGIPVGAVYLPLRVLTKHA